MTHSFPNGRASVWVLAAGRKIQPAPVMARCRAAAPAVMLGFEPDGAVLLVAGDLHAGVGGRFALAEAERAVRGDAAECLGPVMAAAAAGTLRRAAVDDQAILAMAELEGQQIGRAHV